MAIIAISSSKRWIPRALRDLSRTTTILLVMILIGAAITWWSRSRIDTLLRVDEGAMLTFAIDAIDGDCGTPSVYLAPEPEGEKTRYRLLIDFLGGPNRFPMLGGGTTVPVLALPDNREPGVGLGRGLAESCDRVSLTLSGEFRDYGAEDRFPRVGDVPTRNVPHMTMSGSEPGVLALEYRRPAEPSQDAALAAITIHSVADRWQQGSKRITLINEGVRDINVFVHEEPEFQFVNAQDALVRPIGVRTAYVDTHLAPPGQAADNGVVVYRRRSTADIELQHDLIGISTIFGIGVSLLVEGVIVLVISFTSAGAARAGASPDEIQTNTTAIEEGQDKS